MRRRRRPGRNRRMDLYRGVAIYAVISIHVLFPGPVGIAVRALARFAVPFFFLTAGYFSLNAPAWALWRRAVRTLEYLCVVCVPYFFLDLWLTVRRGRPVLEWLSSVFNWEQLVRFLGCQTVPLSYGWQLWFLGALAVVYLWWWMLTLLCRSAGRKLPYGACAILGLVLLAVHLYMGELGGLLGWYADNLVLHSALLDGLPFFALGAWCAKRRRELKRLDVPWHILIAAGAGMSLLEAWLAGRQEIYLGTLVLLAGLMGRCLRYRRAPEGTVYDFLQLCGRKLTLGIYAIHLLVLALIREVPALSPLTGLEWLMPAIVAIPSTLLALAIAWGREVRSQKRGSAK